MILGGGQCQKCKCIPCDPCEQECTNPHTGDPFEVVYTLYSLGAEIGNTTDGYLTASGSRDEDDPYDGMDGSSPWYQQIVGGFSFGPTVTRNPCYVRVSFWRSTRTLGPATFPPPSSTLTVSRVTLTCTAGKVRYGEYVISEGESQDFDVSFPLVAGTGDQSEDDPRSSVGTFSVTPVCRDASFSITARIEWTTSNRLHTLYGIVRECYEIGTPCAEFCDGDPAPDDIYLTLSNITVSDSEFVAGFGLPATGLDEALNEALDSIENTLVLSRVPGLCSMWEATYDGSGVLCNIYVQATSSYIYVSGAVNVAGYAGGNLSGCKESFWFYSSTGDNPQICTPSYSESGSSSGVNNGGITSNFSAYGGVQSSVSLDWEIEV